MSISSNASSGGCAGCRKCRSCLSSSRSSSPSSLRSYSLNQLRKRGRRFASRTVARSPGAAKGLRAAKGLSGTTLTSQTHPSIFACSCAVFASRLELSFCCLRCEACLSRESGGKDSGSRTHAQGPMANGSGAPASQLRPTTCTGRRTRHSGPWNFWMPDGPNYDACRPWRAPRVRGHQRASCENS